MSLGVLGQLFDTGRGIFMPGGYGGGVFDGNLSGLGEDPLVPVTTMTTGPKQYLVFAGGVVVGVVGLWLVSSIWYEHTRKRSALAPRRPGSYTRRSWER